MKLFDSRSHTWPLLSEVICANDKNGNGKNKGKQPDPKKLAELREWLIETFAKKIIEIVLDNAVIWDSKKSVDWTAAPEIRPGPKCLENLIKYLKGPGV